MLINAQAVFSVKWLAVMNITECSILLSLESKYLNFTTRGRKFLIPAPSALRLGVFRLVLWMRLV
jgi:hypothetical protein